MRNMVELVNLLREFEECWCMGTEHLLNERHRRHLELFSALIENKAMRYTTFKQ